MTMQMPRATTAGLPPVTSYRMPRSFELPVNQVSWRPDPARVVLLIHDMQRYFLSLFPSGVSPVVDLVDNVRKLRRTCRAAGIPVLYTAQPGDMSVRERGLLVDFWGPGMSASPSDRAVVEELAPGEADLVFTKWRYSAFHRSNLLDHLRRLGRDQVLVCGVYAHVGCLMTAQDAFAHDIAPFLVADAVADFSLAYHRLALEYAAARCAAVMTTAAVVTELRSWVSPARGR